MSSLHPSGEHELKLRIYSSFLGFKSQIRLFWRYLLKTAMENKRFQGHQLFGLSKDCAVLHTLSHSTSLIALEMCVFLKQSFRFY